MFRKLTKIGRIEVEIIENEIENEDMKETN